MSLSPAETHQIAETRLSITRVDDQIPSVFQIWIAASIGLALKLASGTGFFRADEIPVAIRAVLLIAAVLSGVLAGIGLAIVVRAFWSRRFQQLQPGFWFAGEMFFILLAELAALPWAAEPGFVVGISAFYTGQIVNMFVQGSFALMWYVLVLRTTQEKLAWKLVAWLSIALYASSLLVLPLSYWGATGSADFALMLTYAVYGVSLLAALARYITCLVAIIMDATSRSTRSSLHWVCIALPIACWIFQMLTIFG